MPSDANQLARIARAQRDHPGWSWSDAEQYVTDQADEYEADRTAVPSE